MAYKTIDRRLAWNYLKQLKTEGKTPISLAMELATKLGVVAEFQETKELKWSTVFKFTVTLGDIKAVGVGSSKKEAKQNSAKELIKQIENESECWTPSTPKYQSPDESSLSSSSPMSSFSNSTSDSPHDRNVIGELQNLAAKRKWELPEYEFEEPVGEAHSKTFTCLVKMMSDLQCTGVGSSKKAAKKQAAEKMLDLLGQDGSDFDMIDSPQTPMSQTSRYSNAGSPREILNDSDLDDYTSSDSDSPSPARKLDLSSEGNDDLKCDELSQEKLTSCGEKYGFKVEYIDLPNKSIKGRYQVFVKLTFSESMSINRHPIVTHGTGETRKIAMCRAAERAQKHLELMLSMQ